jgi:cysteine desulfurase/selenocysteine lyase
MGVNNYCVLKEDMPIGSAPALMDNSYIRQQFPALRKPVNTIFFDNAATAQKPQQVVEAMRSFYEDNCANANRAAYAQSNRLHHEVEQTRSKIAKFINAEAIDIAYTSGATESLNLVALSWGMHNLNDGDEVMLCLEDHQSAVLPWFNLKAHLKLFGKNINIVPFVMHYSGVYDWKSLKEKISSRTRLVAMSHIHHLYGLEWDAKDLAKVKAELPANTLISLDTSQSVGHTIVDVKKLDVDFISFSGHKVFASNGIGVLWAHPNIRETLNPFRIGSKSSAEIRQDTIHIDRSTLAGILECGTLNLPAIYSLNSAIGFIEAIGLNNIEAYVSQLTRLLYKRLTEIPTIVFAPGVASYKCAKGFGIVSFRITGIASPDMAQYLDQHRILVRSGDHCLGIKHSPETDYLRISLHIYNTAEEIDYFIETIREVLESPGATE